MGAAKETRVMTDRAAKCVLYAEQEARRKAHLAVDCGHLLFGLAKEGLGVAANCLLGIGLSPEAIQKTFGDLNPQGESVIDIGKLPYTPRLRQAIVRANEITGELGHGYIGTEHLLIGLLDDGQNAAAVVISQHADIAEFRQRILDLIASRPDSDGPVAKVLLREPLGIRDYFAANAMQGLLTNTEYSPRDIAESAYQYADAMLAARAKASIPQKQEGRQ